MTFLQAVINGTIQSTENTMNAVTAQNLTKAYGSETALNALNFEVREGELFGFIGPDGAGKHHYSGF